MSVGFAVTKPVIDAQVGSLCIQLRDDLANVKKFKAFLDLAAQSDNNLISLGYSQAEVTLLKTNVAILDQLRQVWEGTLAVPSPVNIQSFITPFISTS